MSEIAAMSEETMARRGLKCLYIEVPEAVARDLEALVCAAFDNLHKRLREAHDERDLKQAECSANSYALSCARQELSALRAAESPSTAEAVGSEIDSLLERHRGAMTKVQYEAAAGDIRSLITEAVAAERDRCSALAKSFAEGYAMIERDPAATRAERERGRGAVKAAEAIERAIIAGPLPFAEHRARKEG
jgi:hypothetical protein